MARTRSFFGDRGFLEVETPLLSCESVVDRHLDPLPVVIFGDPTRVQHGRQGWLQTSPELGMKRLLAEGFPSVYQICKAFRGAERGPRHNVEFTMVEWYGVGHDYDEGMRTLSDLCEALLRRGPARRIAWRDLFIERIGLDPATATRDDWLAAAERAAPERLDDRWRTSAAVDELTDLLLTSVIEPDLGRTAPAIVCDWPADQAALAQVRHDEVWPVAERFELYVDGMELANGYHELLDADVLEKRVALANEQRRQDGKFALPAPEKLLAAMRKGLPPCAGCALGFDRVVMLATGARTIDEVLAFGVDEA